LADTWTTISRPRSDLRILKHKDVSFVEFKRQLIGVTLIVCLPEEIKPKASKIGIMKE
ncbi:hypothetical protein BCV72DRAFT_181794, partial [Rhizopus microsporus var. microsporus]